MLFNGPSWYFVYIAYFKDTTFISLVCDISKGGYYFDCHVFVTYQREATTFISMLLWHIKGSALLLFPLVCDLSKGGHYFYLHVFATYQREATTEHYIIWSIHCTSSIFVNSDAADIPKMKTNQRHHTYD